MRFNKSLFLSVGEWFGKNWENRGEVIIKNLMIYVRGIISFEALQQFNFVKAGYFSKERRYLRREANWAPERVR